jgi:hypothetical protein
MRKVRHFRRTVEEFLFVEMFWPDLDQEQIRRASLEYRIQMNPTESRIAGMSTTDRGENRDIDVFIMKAIHDGNGIFPRIGRIFLGPADRAKENNKH